jgi:hypothetical protein
MRNSVIEETEELLYELGYDDREDNFYGKESSMVKFMREMRMEQLREASKYISFMNDYSDDQYISMKNGAIERIM